jgi:hypothetical protein
MLLRTSRSDAPSIAASAAIAITGMLIARRGESTAAWAILAASCTAAIIFIAPRFAMLTEDVDAATLKVTAWGVRHFNHSGLHEAVAWDDLHEVSVVTTARDGHEEDMFIVLRGRHENSVVVPHTLAVESGMLSELHDKLSSFDDDAFADAIATHEDSRFVLWRAEQLASADPGPGSADVDRTAAAPERAFDCHPAR